MRRATSQTHEHLLSIIHTETLRYETGRVVRILDAGCGNCHLIAYLLENLPVLNPSLVFNIFGFDVSDPGVQAQGYFEESIHFLNHRFPGIRWENQLSLISSTDHWPYPDEHFDAIVSNQVLEHVTDHDFFFSENYRTLRSGGISAHLFPLYHHIIESHLWLPFVHHIKNIASLRLVIKTLSWIGLGKYPAFKRDHQMSLDEFTEQHVDFILSYTNYLRSGEVMKLAKKHRFRGSFKYTQEYYWRKTAEIFKRKPKFQYSSTRSGFVDWVAVSFLKYVSSVTLILEKKFIIQSTFTE